MICDAHLQFDPSGTAITASAASANIIDLSQDRDLGETDLDLVVTVQQTFTAAGAATLTVEWQTSTDEAFTSPITLVKSRAYALADLAAGAEILPIDIPYGTKRYNRLYYTVATGPMTAGKVCAQLVVDRARPTAYKAGTDVSAI